VLDQQVCEIAKIFSSKQQNKKINLKLICGEKNHIRVLQYMGYVEELSYNV